MRRLFIITFLLLGVSMNACTRNRTVYHGIDRAKNNDKTEILEAKYGDSWHTSGTVNMIPPDFLYVKWRDKTTDKVYEDRVDLTKRLPSFEKMHGQTVYFLVENNQLYVYLIPRTEWGTKLNHRPKEKPPNGPYESRYLDVKTLYPDNDPPRVRGLSERQRERVARDAREEGREEQ